MKLEKTRDNIKTIYNFKFLTQCHFIQILEVTKASYRDCSQIKVANRYQWLHHRSGNKAWYPSNMRQYYYLYLLIRGGWTLLYSTQIGNLVYIWANKWM